ACGVEGEAGGRALRSGRLPLCDVPAAVKELERAQDELGLTGIVITDFTEPWGLPPLSHPQWDPLWDAAQARGVPVNFHIGSGGGPIRLWGQYPPARALAALSTTAQIGNLVRIGRLISSG